RGFVVDMIQLSCHTWRTLLATRAVPTPEPRFDCASAQCGYVSAGLRQPDAQERLKGPIRNGCDIVQCRESTSASVKTNGHGGNMRRRDCIGWPFDFHDVRWRNRYWSVVLGRPTGAGYAGRRHRTYTAGPILRAAAPIDTRRSLSADPVACGW